MKNIFVLSILIFLFACSGGGSGSGSGGGSINNEPLIKNQYIKSKDISVREYIKILNAIPILKGRGSFTSTSNLESKHGQETCVGDSNLKISYDRELNRSVVSRKATKISGKCKGENQTINYKTSRDLNLSFLYKMVESKNVKISEGTIDGKMAYSLIDEGKDQSTIYLLSVNGELLDSFQSEYVYQGNDLYYKIRTKIYPAADSKIEGNLIEGTPETGDILELSEYPLYFFIP